MGLLTSNDNDVVESRDYTAVYVRVGKIMRGFDFWCVHVSRWHRKVRGGERPLRFFANGLLGYMVTRFIY
jgi:hypothetical protein